MMTIEVGYKGFVSPSFHHSFKNLGFHKKEIDDLRDNCSYLNIREERIQFTIEKEVDGVLPFLVLSIKRDKDCLITKVSRKTSIHSDICIGGLIIQEELCWV